MGELGEEGGGGFGELNEGKVEFLEGDEVGLERMVEQVGFEEGH